MKLKVHPSLEFHEKLLLKFPAKQNPTIPFGLYSRPTTLVTYVRQTFTDHFSLISPVLFQFFSSFSQTTNSRSFKMASASSMPSANHRQDLKSLLECSICLETFDEPRTLPCLHSFCKKCLENFVDGKRDDELNCPVCRTKFALNKEGKDISLIAHINTHLVAYKNCTCINAYVMKNERPCSTNLIEGKWLCISYNTIVNTVYGLGRIRLNENVYILQQP